MSVFFLTHQRSLDIFNFVFAYVIIRWIFTILAFFYLFRRIALYKQLHLFKPITKNEHINYLSKGLPLALCFGAESISFLIFSFVSKGIGGENLPAYQACLHFLSIIYMVSIGVANATGIISAKHYDTDINLFKQTYWRGIIFGLALLTPCLLACYFFKSEISLLYTSNEATRRLIESSLIISIPFLIFEYIYIVTRSTLRGIGDFWVPTLFTIFSLNIFGISTSILLLSNFEYSLRSIFLSFTTSSLLLMFFLLFRLRKILIQHVAFFDSDSRAVNPVPKKAGIVE
ncbi:MATE family efflux transporter [Pseudomonas akapageensis]|uniref:MATE family efflux transporter n=1 Tax=Pseudomonas akapageensis TaxID=2609961 RepID=UPI001FE373C5|nr:MATE family efflux transporter [Pseudomonas akapageensis]